MASIPFYTGKKRNVSEISTPIDDDQSSSTTTYSSDKINELDAVNALTISQLIRDEMEDGQTGSSNHTWSISQIQWKLDELSEGGGGGGDIVIFPSIICDRATTQNSYDWYLNEIITRDITINEIRLSPSTLGSDPTRVAIYRGSDLTATLVGQSASKPASSLQKPYTTYTLIPEANQNLSFTRNEKIVFALAVGGTSTTFRAITTLGDNKLAWINTTDSRTGFPAVPRGKGQTCGMFPALTFVG
jgi:hypothetical protein